MILERTEDGKMGKASLSRERRFNNAVATVDLRYPAADERGVAKLSQWLKGRFCILVACNGVARLIFPPLSYLGSPAPKG